jgi:hypothetical protein
MVLCEDGKLYFFRENLDFLNKIPFDPKYSVGLLFNDKTDTLTILGMNRNFVNLFIDSWWFKFPTEHIAIHL